MENKETSGQIATQGIVPPVQPNSVALYLITLMGTTAMVLLAVTLIIVLRPEKDNSSLIVSIIGFGATIVTALITFIRSTNNSNAIQNLHLAVNSRLTALLEQTALASKAEGVKQETDKQQTGWDNTVSGPERPLKP